MLQAAAASLGDLYTTAPPVVRAFGVVALACGPLGLMLGLWWSLRDWHTCELRVPAAFSEGAAEPAQFSGLASVLSSFGDVRQPRTMLSPDAAWEFVSARLQSHCESRRAVIRFLAYVPLLLGLCGTMLGLSQLLPKLGLQMEDATRVHLAGVFLGTLFGIIGSVLAGLGGLIFGSTSEWVMQRLESTIHDHLLPRIPEQRVGVKIEEGIAKLIGEKAESVAVAFRAALAPVAKRLEESATASANAAVNATAAFDQAVNVLQNAGRLDEAARVVAAKLKLLGTSSTALENAAARVEAACTADDRARTSLVEATTLLERAAKAVDTAMGTTDKALGTHAQALATSSGKLAEAVAELNPQVGGITKAFEGLAKDVSKRNELEESKLATLEKNVGGLASPVDQLAKAVSGVNQELSGLRTILEGFSDKATKEITTVVQSQLTKMSEKLAEVLNQLGGVLPAEAARLRLAGQDLQQSIDQGKIRTDELRGVVSPLTEALKGYVQELKGLCDAINQLDRPSPPGATPAVDLSPLKEPMAQVVLELKQANRQLARLPSPATNTARQPWWRRFRNNS